MYCLWLGYRAQHRLENIADSGSIIFKQKIEMWARKATELGIEPVIKLSRKVNLGADGEGEPAGSSVKAEKLESVV